MSIVKKKEHMSKAKTKSDNLPSLQKKIILHLAETHPKTINETKEEILSNSYKPTWIAFNSLEKKKLITKTTVKKYNKRDFPAFWLTDEGMLMALMEGAKADRLLEQSTVLYPDAKIIHCFLEIIPFFDTEFIKMSYSAVKGKGKLEPIEVVQLILSGAATAMDVETGKKVAATLKKYPEQYTALKIAVQFMIDQLQQIIAD